jgi:hypothetical protein
MSAEYGERIGALYQAFSRQRVQMLVVNSNMNESDADVEEQRKAAALPFPIYRDTGAQLAETLNARATPTAVVLDSAGAVRYIGRIDDSRNPAAVKREHLRLALEAILNDRFVEVPQTRVLGCTIKSTGALD